MIRHAATLAVGVTGGVYLSDHGMLLFWAGAAVAVLVIAASGVAWRIVRRVDRALPDHGAERHCEQCGETIHKPSQARFCSVGCREYAARARRAQQYQAELGDGCPL